MISLCNEKVMKKKVSLVKSVKMRGILNFPNWVVFGRIALGIYAALLERVLDLSGWWKVMKSFLVEGRRWTAVLLKNSFGSLWFGHTFNYLDVCCGPGFYVSKLIPVCKGCHTCRNKLPRCAELEWVGFYYIRFKNKY